MTTQSMLASHANDCTYKQRFASRSQARKACTPSSRRKRDVGLKIEPYRCLCCRQWHLGHQHPPTRSPRFRGEPIDGYWTDWTVEATDLDDEETA